MSAQVPVLNAPQPNCDEELKQACIEMDRKAMQRCMEEEEEEDE